MKKWFNKQGKLVQLILLLIPITGWIVEILVRWEKALKTKGLLDIILAIIVTFGGAIIGLIDFILVLLFGHLILDK